MTKPDNKPATYRDLQIIADNVIGELFDGEIVTSPRPSFRHAHIAKKVTSILTRAFEDGVDGPGGWWLFPEPELHLGGDAFVPDIAGWRRERVPDFPDVVSYDVIPDWICEVLSPGTRRIDYYYKLPRYGKNGVPWVWLVDPAMRDITIHRLENGRYPSVTVYFDHDGPVRAEPFGAIELEVASFWPPTAPDPRN
jgi:Uma2 family endonuclease